MIYWIIIVLKSDVLRIKNLKYWIVSGNNRSGILGYFEKLWDYSFWLWPDTWQMDSTHFGHLRLPPLYCFTSGWVLLSYYIGVQWGGESLTCDTFLIRDQFLRRVSSELRNNQDALVSLVSSAASDGPLVVIEFEIVYKPQYLLYNWTTGHTSQSCILQILREVIFE